MATAAYLNQAYLAYFGRPVDYSAVTAWSTASNAEVEAAFFASPESQALYGNEFNAAQVSSYYQNLFGRPAEPAGIQYWLGQVALGNVTAAGAAVAILNGAQGTDAVAVQNKLVASAGFTTGLDTTSEIIGYTGTSAAASARAFLATVTATPATQAEIDAAIIASTMGGGQTFTLTNDTDIATSNTFNSGLVYTPGGNDRINALQDEDQLTGSGVAPTLNATLGNANDNGGQYITPKLTGIEIINVAFTGSGGAANGAVTGLDLQDATGVDAVNINRVSEAVDSAEVGNIQSVVSTMSIHNSHSNQLGWIEFSFGSGVLAGLNTGVLTLDNVGLNVVSVGQNNNSITNFGVSTRGYENLGIVSTGAANSVGTMQLPMDTGTAGAITITGDQNLNISTSNNITNAGLVEVVIHAGGIVGNAGRLATVDASGLAAALTLNIPAGMLSTGKAETSGVPQNVTITGTANNDTFYLNDAVQAGDAIVGGAGTDTLVVYTGGVTTGSATGVESVDIQSNNAAVTMDMSKVPDATLVNIRNIGNNGVNSVDSGADALITLNNLTAVMGAGLNIQHSTTFNGAIFDTTVQANLASSTGATDLVGISINEGVNADPRFNFTLLTNADVATTAAVERVENITITDNDSESNSVELGSFPTHTGAIVLTGGVAGTFLNLDVNTVATTVTGLKQLDITGTALDGTATTSLAGTALRDLGWMDVGASATEVRLNAATINASAEVSDVIVRVNTTAANPNGGQAITMGAGNDTVIFDDISPTSLTQANAGLTNADTVIGGAGNNILVIDGNGVNVVLQQSEWDNVSGFQTIYLAGNGAGNQYFLQLDNDMIAANGAGGTMITIDNDDDSFVNNQANAFFNAAQDVSAGTGASNNDRVINNTAVRLDATTLSANAHFTYDGEEGTGATLDRFVVNDNNTNGGNIIDGGDVNISVAADATGVLRQLVGVQSNDVIEVRNTATVTTADLSNVMNVGNIVINNDQAVLQTLNLSLNSTVADAMSDSGHTATLTEIETLSITANDGLMADAAGSAIVPSAAARIVLDARGISGAFGLTVTGDGTFAANDTISMALNLGGAAQTFNLALGTDTVSLYGFNVASNNVQTNVNGDVQTVTVYNSTFIASQTFTLTSVEVLNYLTAAGGTAAVSASSFYGGFGNDIISGSNVADYIDAWWGADRVTTGAGADRVYQGGDDSVAASVTVFAGATVAAGDTMTFGGGVDVITDFTAGAGGDELDVLVAGLATTLIGETVANLTGGAEVFFVSGNYAAATGVFTITADGVGADTAIVQADNLSAASDDLTTNASIVVLVGVDSDNLVAANFV